MADEMLSKNFLEDKRTNQKNLFEKELAVEAKQSGNSGRSLNMDDLMASLKD